MHVTWAAGWALVGVLSGGVAAFDGFDVQKPFSRSGFRVSSEQTIVPLDDKAGTGLLPPALENGAIASLGPTFMNVIYQNSTETELGSCWGCVVTIGKELPCAYDAVKTGSFSPLLNCGVDKSDLCNCVDCLPDAVSKFVKGFCAAKGKHKNAKLKNPLAQSERIADEDLNFQGFKGSLPKATADDLKSVNFCPGSSCGACDCCVGACVFGVCGGFCAG